MPTTPPAEIDVDLPLVRRLLQSQHPDLAHLPLAPLAHGWDNEMVRVGQDLVVRLPRRQLAAALIEHEQRWLPVLGPRLPLPTPVPVRVGTPADGMPWSWSVVPYLPGGRAAEAELDQAAVAATLAAFLLALHTPAPADAPVNPVRGVPLRAREGSFHRILAQAVGIPDVDADAADRLWTAAAGGPAWSGPALWLHGDLHPGNLLADEGRLTAVVDFGDLTSGDPATDLAAAWMLLDEDPRADFWQAYRAGAAFAVDAALVDRARAWALQLGLLFLVHADDAPWLRTVGARTVSRVLVDAGHREGPLGHS